MSRRVVICVGRAPLAGCRTTLTAVERNQFETHCEDCEMAFHDRWRAWCLGDQDPDLDELFGDRKQQAKRRTNNRQAVIPG